MPARARNNDAMTQPLTLHPDRLFPAEPQTRAVARKLYEQVKDLPIISPHGHVPPAWIADDIPFKNPTDLLLTPDHYVNRILHGQGVDLGALGVPVGRTDFTEEQAREAGLDKLSMGMSGDYETAIAFGATSVRVGSAIFGSR